MTKKYRKTWREAGCQPAIQPTASRRYEREGAAGYANLPPVKVCPECQETEGRHESWCGVKARIRRGQA